MFSPTFLVIFVDLVYLSFIQQKSLKHGTQFSVLAVSYQTIMLQAVTLPQNLLAWRGSNTLSVVGDGKYVQAGEGVQEILASKDFQRRLGWVAGQLSIPGM